MFQLKENILYTLEMFDFVIIFILNQYHNRFLTVVFTFQNCFFQEEVMTMERILLKTIKFDLQVEHPYGCMLKFAKNFKGNLFF